MKGKTIDEGQDKQMHHLGQPNLGQALFQHSHPELNFSLSHLLSAPIPIQVFPA
jgi:hypothetical protein